MLIYVMTKAEFDLYASEDTIVSDSFYTYIRNKFQEEANKKGIMYEVQSPGPDGFTCFVVYPED